MSGDDFARQQLLLEMRNEIADKEFAVACANRELQMGGWLSDWHECIRQCDQRIGAILDALKQFSGY